MKSSVKHAEPKVEGTTGPKRVYERPTAFLIRTEQDGRVQARCKPGGAFCLQGRIG